MGVPAPIQVLGCGPAALVAAILTARYGREVQLVSASSSRATRIDSAPAPLLAFLIELGVHPSVIATDSLHDSLLSSWTSERPELVRASPKVHLDRRKLDDELLRIARASGVVIAEEPEAFRPAADTIDATGRRALTAPSVMRPPDVWIARSYMASGSFSRAQTSLRIAALPQGYVYRIGVEQALTLGVVLPKSTPVTGADECEMLLKDAGAGWVLSGLGSMTDLQPGRGGPCSMQVSQGGSTRAIGDAAFAPDALASQGLAAAVSAAIAFAETGRTGAPDALVHIANLSDQINRCRFRKMRAWVDYLAWINSSARAALESSVRTTQPNKPLRPAAQAVASAEGADESFQRDFDRVKAICETPE